MNTQELESTELKDPLFQPDTLYPVMEHFYTIQGEGLFTGVPAYFIRLAGCDVGCPWCDVKESWDRTKHPDLSISDLLHEILQTEARHVVITGGEPLLHDLTSLTASLKEVGLRLHLETSGSSPLTGHFDWITFSPKRFKQPVDSIYQQVDELKVVIVGERDFRWAERHADACRPGTSLLLQPEWETPTALPMIIDYVRKNPKWRISLQTHKFMNVP